MSESGERICVSVVSHRQARLVRNLLDDLAGHCAQTVEVVLTLNVEEPLPFEITDYGYPVKLVRNPSPKGFGANHNAAFHFCRARMFCVLNPDIRLASNPFPPLVEELEREGVGVVAPRIVDPSGRTEDSARRFPTLLALVRKALRHGDAHAIDYEMGAAAFSPDWVAGMFMLFRSDAFTAVGGFDDRYFLYYEDVDLCARLRARGCDVRAVPAVTAVHDARRASRSDWRHRAWHLRSALRYLSTRTRPR